MWRNSFKRYATEFDTQREGDSMDNHLRGEEYIIDQNKFKNRMEFYKFILERRGFEVIGDTRLGKGTFGDVYKIKSLVDKKLFAVKIMLLKRFDEFNKTRFEVFKREVYCLTTTPHKNIIKLIQHFIVNDFMSFLIMELADAGDLKARLTHKHDLNGRGFDEYESKFYLVQIAEAVHFVHSKSLFHGDLKLDNVLIKTYGQGKEVIKVTDFGCAQIAFDAKTGVIMKKRAVGTVIYMSPEQLRVYMYVNLKMKNAFKYEFTKYNPFKSDVWALGVCLYRLLFYNYPFEYEKSKEKTSLSKMLTKMKSGFKTPNHITKDLTIDCRNILKELLTYNKDSRIDMKTVMSHKWIDSYNNKT